MADAYDLRSNIKGKPGSQGTLFQVKDKSLLNPDQRWPRGYTPERQAAVNQELHGANSAFLLSDKAGTGPQRRDLNETIKRSTVPPEHLGGVKFLPGQESLGANTLGLYYREGPGRPQAEITILRGQETTDTPIHEIGHHVSANEATEHSQYHTGYQRGKEEGFADSYAFEHFRDRRGEPMKDMRVYPTPAHPDQSHRLNFQSAYMASRTHIPSGGIHAWLGSAPLTPRQQAFRDGKESEDRGETLFHTWDNGDGTVDFEHRSKEWPYGDSRTKVGWTPKGEQRG